tara:strand:+ start:314 stop:1150 length:837 start_codon:yes stop_codon:yes gene_type:complete
MLSKNGTFIYTRKKERIVVCLVGVINRSIKHTWFSIYNNIIMPLKKKYIVDIVLFNNNVEDTMVDGVKLNNRDLKIVPYNYLFKFKQKDFDKKISEIAETDKEFPPYWCNKHKLNGLRQMYMESKVSEFLKKSKYKLALVTNGDHLYINEFVLGKKVNDGIITCSYLDMKGYTNGFYFGYTKNMVKILDRINYYDKLIDKDTTKINYEKILKRSFKISKIKRNITNLLFIKIRANKDIQKFGINFILNDKEWKNLYLEYLKKNKDKHEFYKYLLSIYK